MTYPRIYSLSTVGILKHYVHDYLFHPFRTDFVGDNGVGKSIIADLLQILFVYDSELIRFGTDGLQQEKRNIESLPYKSRIAYCTVNLEVREREFLTIGICINSGRGRHIVPFIISKEADLRLELDRLVLTGDELLFATDIPDNSTVPDLNTLAKRLLTDKRLCLNFFRTKEEINSYYKFLYEKEILPLNLANEKSLRAYAKVIQSFSRAKSLNLSGANASRSLKEFLFEETDKEIVEQYTTQRGELEKILKEYKRLNEDIKTLERKQEKLENLMRLEATYKSCNKELKHTRLSIAYNNLQVLRKEEIEGKSMFKQKQDELSGLKTICSKLPRVEIAIERSLQKANENYELHTEYKHLFDSMEILSKELNELSLLVLPKLNEEWVGDCTETDIDLLTVEQLKSEVEFARPYLKKYPTLKQLLAARDMQANEIDAQKSGLVNQKNQNENLLKLLSGKDENSLMNWFLQNLPKLDKEKKQAILYFASASTGITQKPKNAERFLNAEKFFEDFDIISDSSKKGFWIRLGSVSEFIEFTDDVSFLSGNGSMQQSITKLTKKLESEIAQIDNKLAEYRKITDGLPYSEEIIPINFDLTIVKIDAMERLKKAVYCILHKEKMVQHLLNKKNKYSSRIDEIANTVSVNFTGREPEVLRRSFDAVRKLWQGRLNKIKTYSGGKSELLKSCETDVARLKDNLFLTSERLVKSESEFNKLQNEYYNEFTEVIEDFPAITRMEDELETAYNNAYGEYTSKYIETATHFAETANERNTGVKIEINNRSYSFRVLEEALLGSKVKTTDNIAAALFEANQNRLTIADGIRDNMINVFDGTVKSYKKYKEQVQSVNVFFKERKISNRFSFKLSFTENKAINISLVNEMTDKVRLTAKQGELNFNQSIDEFVEEFFKKVARLKEKVPIDKLLNPRTYFELAVSLTDQNDLEIPGSTGETYSAIALLGIARLSVASREYRKGLRFIILEEIGSLDSTNFNTFPAIAEEFDYQIITMAPHPFNIGLTDEWYAHHLIKGKDDENINYNPSASYFKTSKRAEQLEIYLKRNKK